MSRVTKAERAAIDAISRHPGVKAAAFALGKSPHTVAQQLETARRRLGVETTGQLIRAVLVETGPE